MAQRGGKYAAVLPGLPKAAPEDTVYQAKVDAEKEKYLVGHQLQTIIPEDAEREGIPRLDAVPVVDLANYYAYLNAEYDRLKLLEYVNNLRIAAVEQLLVAAQEHGNGPWGQFGVKSNALRLAGGETVRVQPEPYAKVVDPEAFRLWCIANGFEKKLQLWPSTMAALVKERLLTGDALPDGTDATVKTKVVFVAAKGEDG